MSSTDRLLLAGDFNFHVNDPSENTANKFLDLLSCFNLEVCNVYTPTHKNNNVLDLIVTRSGEETVLNFRLSLITSLFIAPWLSRDHLKLSSPSHHVNCEPLIQTTYGVIFVPPPYITHHPRKLRNSVTSMTRFYFQSWTNMHLCAQKSSLCDLMLLGTARKLENRNQTAASLKGAGDALNLNQTIDLMLINALLFKTPFSSQKWITTLILFRRLATTTKPYFL